MSAVAAATERPASLPLRLAALLYDAILVAGLLFAGGFVVVAARQGAAVPAGDPLYRAFLVLEVAAYFIGFWRFGQTPGMRAWRLHLRAEPTGHPTLRQATLRFVVAVGSAGLAGAGFLAALGRADRATWHDRASRTRLVQRS